MDPLKGVVNDVEQAGEKLAAAGAADLAGLIQTLLEKAADYNVKVTLTLSLEKKTA